MALEILGGMGSNNIHYFMTMWQSWKECVLQVLMDAT